MPRTTWTEQEQPLLELLRDSGGIAGLPDLDRWAADHNLSGFEVSEMLEELDDQGFIHFRGFFAAGHVLTRIGELRLAPEGDGILGCGRDATISHPVDRLATRRDRATSGRIND